MTVDELLIEIKAKNDQAKKALKDTRKEVLDTSKKTRDLRNEIKLLNKKAKIDSGALKASKEYSELQRQIQNTTRELERLQRKQSAISPLSPKTTESYAEVKAQAEALGKKFDSLIDKEAEYKTFDRSSAGIKDLWDDLQNEIAETAAELGYYEEKMRQMEESGQAFLPNEKWEQLQGEIQETTSKLDEYKAAEKAMLSNGTAVDSETGGQSRFAKMRGAINDIVKKVPLVGKSARAARGGVDSLLSGFRGLWNIAKMFVIGSGLAGWVNATKQGFSNLAGYSNRTRASLETLKSALGTLKNAFATALAPILDVVAPVLAKVIDWFTAAATAVAHLFSALTGKSFTVVARKATSGIGSVGSAADDASGSVDKLKRSLMGFDQINKLDDNSGGGGGGGGGGGAAGAGSMFDTVDIGADAMALADMIKEAWKNADFTELGTMLGEKIKGALESIPWEKIQETANKIAKSIATFLNGFLETPGLWTVVGHTFAEALNTVIGFGYTFVTEFHWSSLGKAIADAVNGAFEKIDLAKAAKALSGAIKGVLDTVYTALSEINWEQIGSKIGEFLVNVDWVGVAGKVAKVILASFKASLSVLDGLGEAILQAIQDGLKNKFGIEVDLVGLLKKIDQDQLDPKQKILDGATAKVTKKDDSGLTDKTVSGFTAGFTKKDYSAGTDSVKGWTSKFTKKEYSAGTSAVSGWSAKFTKFTDSIKGNKTISGFKAKITSFTDAIKKGAKKILGFIAGKASGGIYMNGSWKPVTTAASGGAFDYGQMFVAREAGPELVGSIGGHTAVMNNDQIVSSVAAGVYKAVAAAMSQGSSDRGTTVVLEGDAATFFRVIQKEARNYVNATGLSPFPV